jgi:hypothetical protein
MRRSAIGRALLVLAAAGLALASGLTPALASGTPGWRTVATISEPSLSTGLLSVAAAGDKGSWAAGFAESGSGGTVTPVLESWTGGTWTPVALSAAQVTKLGAEPMLDSVTASSPSNVWAFTMAGGWLHGTASGTTWTAGRIAKAPAFVESALAIGTDGAWAFGATMGAKGTLVPYAAARAGTGWKPTRVPGKGVIVAASAVSPHDIWAVLGTSTLGVGGAGGGLVHWSGGHWHSLALPAQLRNSSVGSVLARSDTNVWVGGAVRNAKHGTAEAIGHWNGHLWSVAVLRAAASAATYRVASIVTDGAGGLWALGSCSGPKCPNGGLASRLWHQTKGSWTRPVEPKLATSASALLALAPVGRSVWGVGAQKVGKNGSDGLIALWGATP